MTANPLRVGIAGLGTVGTAVATALKDNATLIDRRCGRPVKLIAVSSRERQRDRGIDLSGVSWMADALSLASHRDIDVLVETIGGEEGIARQLVETALSNRKHVVTANKALLAHHGTALALMAEANGVALLFEGAVAGGIPILRTIREGLAADRLTGVQGILNGTCNYILTEMRQHKMGFAGAVAEAQRLGFAEADPAFDVDGTDTAHKLSLLTALAFGTQVDFGGVTVTGVRDVGLVDIEFAEQTGCRIKLLATALQTDHGTIQRVGPCLVPVSASIASVDGVFNAVATDGDLTGRQLAIGRGAGGGPTASAVISDVCQIAAGRIPYSFGMPTRQLAAPVRADASRQPASFYLRVNSDGMQAESDIIGSLRAEAIVPDLVMNATGSALALTVADTTEGQIQRAMLRMAALPSMTETPCLLRREGF